MEGQKFEIKDSDSPKTKRLIIYDTETQSMGFKLTDAELYELYILLRDIYQDII